MGISCNKLITHTHTHKQSQKLSKMKVQLATIASISGLALGGLQKMEEQLGQWLNKTSIGQRALPSSTMSTINRYGCWCYFEDDHGKGKSQPVNEVDAWCKTLHEGYDCAMIDAEEMGATDECVPWEIDYSSANQGTVEEVIDDCNAKNTDDACARAACIVEGKFVMDIFQAFLGGLQLDQSVKHENGFDVMAMCPTKGISGESEKSCCGVYPYRHPFKTFGGNRACCQSKTYDVNILTCCDDGRARMTC